MKALIFSLFMPLALPVFADHHNMMNMQLTPEQRKQMADMHAKAAACLTSNKTFQECHQEMMKSSVHMGKGMAHMGCPMMGTETDTKTKTKTTK